MHQYALHQIVLIQGVSCCINSIQYISAVFQVAEHGDVAALCHVPGYDPDEPARMIIHPHYYMGLKLTDYLHNHITGERVRARIYYHPFRIKCFD